MTGKAVLILSSLFLAVLLRSTDLDQFIGNNYEIFQSDRPRFISYDKMNYFSWTSSKKTTARYSKDMQEKSDLVYLGLPVQEVLINFQENNLKNIYVSVFNRGDSEPITAKIFNQLLLQADAAIQKRIGVRSNPPVRKERLKKNVLIYSRTYPDRNWCYLLKWSSTGSNRKFQPEYIQIELKPFVAVSKESLIPNAQPEKNNKLPEILQDRVKKDGKGNIWIDGIPMVDQGQKGYCVAAVIEQVLRYYGAENVTQHTIAQLAKTDAETGTSVHTALSALKKVQKKFQIRSALKYQFLKSVDEFERFCRNCSNMAKRKKRPRPSIVKKGSVYFTEPTLRSIDPEIYVSVRCADKKGKERFLETVRERIDAGLPTLWGVSLGIVPENKLSQQTRSGHMRLIIGYNKTNREILYTDTWGIGHERKSMQEDNAWAITNYLIAIDPHK